jgi:hypothetical protein
LVGRIGFVVGVVLGGIGVMAPVFGSEEIGSGEFGAGEQGKSG